MKDAEFYIDTIAVQSITLLQRQKRSRDFNCFKKMPDEKAMFPNDISILTLSGINNPLKRTGNISCPGSSRYATF